MPWTTNRRCACYSDPSTDLMPMRSRVKLLLTIVIAVLSLLSAIYAPRVQASETHQFDAAWIPIADGGAQPTAAWSEFCERSAGECAINPAEPATITLDEHVWNVITAINKQVNAAVSPQEDIAHWGVIDRWDYPTTAMAIVRTTSFSSAACWLRPDCRGAPCAWPWCWTSWAPAMPSWLFGPIRATSSSTTSGMPSCHGIRPATSTSRARGTGLTPGSG
jgi:hypothetical protein